MATLSPVSGVTSNLYPIDTVAVQRTLVTVSSDIAMGANVSAEAIPQTSFTERSTILATPNFVGMDAVDPNLDPKKFSNPWIS